jgi:predicted nucleic acid-binding protein
MLEDSVRVPHQAIVEFIDDEAVLRNAIRGCAAYQLNCLDAHLRSYAEHYGLAEIITEGVQHDRLYGSVRVVNPFVDLP